MLSVTEAWDAIIAAVDPCQAEHISLHDAWNAVLAEDVTSTTDSPPFAKSMMDGLAVRIDDLAAKSHTLRIIGEVAAGQTPQQPVESGTAIRIMTGAPIPPDADVVVPVEWTEQSADGQQVTITLPRAVETGLNILPQGHAMRAGEVILQQGQRLRGQEIALLGETGHARPLVRRLPRVAILATGDELVDVDQTPGPGQIRNSNALMLAAQVRDAGARPVLLDISRDQRDELAERIQAGLQCDFLCLSGGVSAGQYDLVPAELDRAGVEKVFHKVAMKPGKPVWFGKRPGRAGESDRFVFGLPGNPVSSMVCFEMFVRTALRRFSGIAPERPQLFAARLARPFESHGDRHTWFPARLTVDETGLLVHPTAWKGSADLRSCVEANGSLSVPAGDINWQAGQQVEFLPWGQSMSL